MRHDNPTRDLAGQIERLAADGQYRPDEWLRFLTMDVLAGFGKRLEQPWDAYRQERLYALTKRYRQLVAENPWRDILGGAYMDISSHGQQRWLGQYFTPPAVADCIAQLTLHDLDLGAIPASRLINIMEPAAGAGVMLLAACGVVATTHGAAALRRFSFTAIDLDVVCAQMTACQLLANGVLHGALGELLVYRGNALGSGRGTGGGHSHGRGPAASARAVATRDPSGHGPGTDRGDPTGRARPTTEPIR
jgi:hypothetical protein